MRIIGTCDSSGLYCLDCSYEDIHADEMRFLRYGFDRPFSRTMDSYPRLDQDGQKVTDDNGDIIVDLHVKLPDDHQVLDSCGLPINLITELSCDTVNGECCSKCGEWLVEPYSLKCFDCGETVASGSRAIELEKTSTNPNGFSFDELFCIHCVIRHQRQLLDKVLEAMSIEHARLRQAENSIVTLFGKITGIDRLFFPRLSFMREIAERVRHATDSMTLMAELEQDLRLEKRWERIEVLTFCLVTIKSTIDQFEAVEVTRLSELQRRLTA